MTDLDISPEHLGLVRAILARHLSTEVKVWVFGSRATGGAKRFSDLDLALQGAQALPQGVLRDLAESFDDSDLPWKVDVLDWAETGAAFRQIIERDRVPFPIP